MNQKAPESNDHEEKERQEYSQYGVVNANGDTFSD